MKKFIVILALFALILPSCTEKNKPEEEISDKPKYLIEISSTSIPGEGYDTNVADTGLVYRYVYERETNPKYLTSYSLYSKDKLQTKIEYTNEGDSQYGEVTYVDNGDDFTVGSNRMSGEKDTTIYLDEERTLIKEEKSPSSHMIVEYDEKNRIISRVIVYNNGQKTPDKDFCYIDIGSINNQEQQLGINENIIKPENAPSRARKIVKYGDIIYSTVRPYLHNMCIIDKTFSMEPIASTGFAVMSCYKGILNKFLFYYLLAPDFDNYANHTDNAKGVAYPAINDERLYNALIPVPPYQEQIRIVDKLEHLLPKIKDLK